MTAGGQLGEALADAGQNIGRAVQQQQTPQERQMEKLAQQLVESQIGESQARQWLAQSEEALNNQQIAANAQGAAAKVGLMSEDGRIMYGPPNPANVGIGTANVPDVGGMSGRGTEIPGIPGQMPTQGMINLVPPEQKVHKSGRPAIVSGTHPGMIKFQMPGFPMDLPQADSAAESLEETPWWMWLGIYRHNKQVYGEQWARKFRKFVGLQEVDETWDALWTIHKKMKAYGKSLLEKVKGK